MTEMNLPDAELSGKSVQEIPDITFTQNWSINKPYYIPKKYIEDVKLTMQIKVDVVDSSGAWDLKIQVDTSLSKDDSEVSNFRKEQQAFNAMREQLKRDYLGKYVAVYGERVVDSDINESTLIRRFYGKYGKVAVYIDKIEEKKRILRVPTPRRIK